MKTALVWFRNDLRLKDNEVINRAVTENDKVIFFYCLDNFWLGQTSYGFDKIGTYRLKFLIESLDNLKQNLQTKGSDLIITIGQTEKEIVNLLNETKFTTIYLQEEFTSEELNIENKVYNEINILNQKNGIDIKVNKIWGQTLIHKSDIFFDFELKSNKTLPDIFTNFRTNIEKNNLPRKIIQNDDLDLNSTSIDIDWSKYTNQWNEIKTKLNTKVKKQSNKSAFKFSGGETQALERLDDYLYKTNSLWTYKNTRNGLLGENYSSKFSPYLALGLISAKQIYWEIKNYETIYGSNISTYWLYFELLWRDYFKFVGVKYGNEIFKYNGIKSKKIKLNHNIDDAKSWLDGKTKEKFVNANMIELNESGWMSNRGRQNVASYLVHDLGLDWRIGAEYFESLLLDYDVTSNWCNWQYISGIGNDPRENRKFNIKLQQEKYDKNYKYIKYWLGDIDNNTLFD